MRKRRVPEIPTGNWMHFPMKCSWEVFTELNMTSNGVSVSRSHPEKLRKKEIPKKIVCVLEFKSEFRFAGALLPVIETDAESKSTIWIKSLIATRIRLEYRFVCSDHLCFGQQAPDLWNFGRDCYRCDGNPSRIGRSRKMALSIQFFLSFFSILSSLCFLYFTSAFPTLELSFVYTSPNR